MKYIQKKTNRRLGSNICIFFIVGILLAIVVLAISGKVDRKATENIIDDAMATLRNQCINYNRIMVTDRTKSLFRLSDQVIEISRDLMIDSSHASEKYIEDYMSDQQLTGIFILDKDLNPELECCKGYNYERWKDILKSNRMKDIPFNKSKVFTERVVVENVNYDIAAAARRDKMGMIFAYKEQSKEDLDDENSDFTSLLNGFSMERGGKFVIAKDGVVIASNEKNLNNRLVSGNSVLRKIQKLPEYNKMETFPDNRVGYMGEKSQYDDFSLYIYFKHIDVFQICKVSMAIYLCAYILLWSISLGISNMVSKANEMKLLEAVQKAQQANNAKTEFLRRISHDIRTPINGIQGMLKMAESCPEDIDKQEMIRNKIMKSSNFLLDLVNDVLDMSKLETDEIKLESKPFSLIDILQEVDELLELQAAERGINFNVYNGECKVQHLIGSPLHVRQILLNIGSNAVKYGRAGGCINVRINMLSATEDTVVYEFMCADDGIGMSEEFQKHMFEPFMQEADGARTKYQGTGLGLAIVKKLVEKMNGTIEVASKKNIGTTFKIAIPFFIDKDYIENDDAVQEKEENVSFEGINVLLVEDNEINMEISEFIMQELGAIVYKAWNGEEAVKAFEKSEVGFYDLILMDIMMPVMSGVDATRAIRKLDREDSKTVPIIAMTANAFSDDRKRNLEVGMNEHISKPIDEKKLIKAMSKYIAN